MQRDRKRLKFRLCLVGQAVEVCAVLPMGWGSVCCVGLLPADDSLRGSETVVGVCCWRTTAIGAVEYVPGLRSGKKADRRAIMLLL